MWRCPHLEEWGLPGYRRKNFSFFENFGERSRSTLSLFRVWSQALSGQKKIENGEVERIEIHLKEAILTTEPLKDTFCFKEEVITLQEVELSSNLGSSPKSGPLFRVILTKRLDLCIEKEKSSLAEVDLEETLLEEKTLSFEVAT